MPNRSSKRDVNQLAAHIVALSTGQESPAPAQAETPAAKVKDPLAVELGRRGGLKGGLARVEATTPEQRSEIARNAAKKRWDKKTQ